MNKQLVRWSCSEQSTALKKLTANNDHCEQDINKLIEQFECFLSPIVCARARQFGFTVEPQEVVNLVFIKLLSEGADGRPLADYAAKADDPWAYIAHSLKHWAFHLWGHRGVNIEFAENFPAKESSTDSEYSTLTPLAEAITVVTNIIAVRVPKYLQNELRPLVQFLAENPPIRRSYESKEREAAATKFGLFNDRQIAAVSNIIWGSRPNNAETSIMGQLLLNSEWIPTSSLSHVKAIKRFEKEMHEASPWFTSKLYA